MVESIIELDKRLFEKLNQHYYLEALDPITVFLTAISEVGLFWWVVVGLLFLCHKRVGGFAAGRTLALSVGIVFILQAVINQFVPRPRPPLSEEGVRLLVDPPLSSSFPSAHAATSFAAMTTLVYFFQAPSTGLFR
ncbi:undecaprenyl-diphosphatase [Salipaludibacillus aurantiacus]|uniref:Undecaprenyl-diphosphatase n=1 Tax=Salipaludibacillus aurantiacus TaxID=1601833 RepID=A0A1H9UGX1_9BACI|nr:phosphatase PAP2 family protein [Salipaludibacillus aurantiacus]SES08511.1 undecaprenyl-diphosphatase [Salipaludibacillus aurantiacus]